MGVAPQASARPDAGSNARWSPVGLCVLRDRIGVAGMDGCAQGVHVSDRNTCTEQRMQVGVLLTLLDWCVNEMKQWQSSCTGKHGSQESCRASERVPLCGLVCMKCKKTDAEPQHTCPYKREINDDNESLCNCCQPCRQDCSDDI